MRRKARHLFCKQAGKPIEIAKFSVGSIMILENLNTLLTLFKKNTELKATNIYLGTETHKEFLNLRHSASNTETGMDILNQLGLKVIFVGNENFLWVD